MNILFIISFIIPHLAFSQNVNEEIAQTMALRQQVELLSTEVEALKNAQQSGIDVYIQRSQEIEGQLLREKFRLKQLENQIKLSKTKLESRSKKVLNGKDTHWLMSFLVRYEKSIKAAHPLFATKLQEKINKIKYDLSFNKISYEHALLQTWYVLETDLNKSKGPEFILAPLQIGQKLYHVEMVRLGRKSGYFRTAEGQYGQIFYDKDWDIQFFHNEEAKNMIEVMLTQFKQQQKTGLFNLPGLKL